MGQEDKTALSASLTDYAYLHLPYQVFAYYSTEQPEVNGLIKAGMASSTLLLGFYICNLWPNL